MFLQSLRQHRWPFAEKVSELLTALYTLAPLTCKKNHISNTAFRQTISINLWTRALDMFSQSLFWYSVLHGYTDKSKRELLEVNEFHGDLGHRPYHGLRQSDASGYGHHPAVQPFHLAKQASHVIN